MILFYSSNNKNITQIKNLSNALLTDDFNFCLEYILNYNKNGLYKLKKEVEEKYKTKLKYTKDILSFSNFINSGTYDNIYNNKLTPNKIYLKPKEEIKEDDEDDDEDEKDESVIYKNK